MVKFYAGIGNRNTPTDILKTMTDIAKGMSQRDWILRSGHALGADYAFEQGSTESNIHLPFWHYNEELPQIQGARYYCDPITPEIEQMAARFHPVWDQLSPGVKKFMCRNATIILGRELDSPVDLVICWTPNGKDVGGTGHALRIAEHFAIPVLNLKRGYIEEGIQNMMLATNPVSA